MIVERQGRRELFISLFDPLAARACRAILENPAAREYALTIGAVPTLIFANPLLGELARRSLAGESLAAFSLADATDLAWPGGERMTRAQVADTIDDLAGFAPFPGDEFGCVERLAEREARRILLAVMGWAAARIGADGAVAPDVATELRRALERAAPHQDDRERPEFVSSDHRAVESAQRVRGERRNALAAQGVAA